jgi:hypothetical protein
MRKKPDRAEPDYIRQAIEKTLAAGIKPGVHHVIVEHEPSCPMLNGGRGCACKPDVTVCEGSA